MALPWEATQVRIPEHCSSLQVTSFRCTRQRSQTSPTSWPNLDPERKLSNIGTQHKLSQHSEAWNTLAHTHPAPRSPSTCSPAVGGLGGIVASISNRYAPGAIAWLLEFTNCALTSYGKTMRTVCSRFRAGLGLCSVYIISYINLFG